jgi:hypothetical protein
MPGSEHPKTHSPLTLDGECYLVFLFFDGCDSSLKDASHTGSSGLELAAPQTAGPRVAPSAAFAA